MFGGCTPPLAPLPLGPEKGKELLTVDFNQGQVLRYRFVSSRDVELAWGPSGGGQNAEAVDKFAETLEMVVAYNPIKVDPFGQSVVKGTFESVVVKRSAPKNSQMGEEPKDPVKGLAGKSFTLKVYTTGRIADYSELDALIRAAGEKSFDDSPSQGRIKNPDMIADVIAGVWFVWDSISSIERPEKGVGVGQSWKSRLSLPTPMLMREARDVTYTLTEIKETARGKVATIKSSYAHAKEAPADWPKPYPPGAFNVRGRFGMLRNFRIEQLQGSGEELFNISAGRVEQSTQHYKMNVSSALLFPLPDANPRIAIDQKLTLSLLGR